MEFGVVFPSHDIGTDPGEIRAFAQGAAALGFAHLLAYDHVLGADPDRPGGWKGVYDKDDAFHEPLTLFAYLAGVTERLGFISNVMIAPQRQTALIAKQAAEVAIVSGGRLRLGIGIGWNKLEYDALGVPFANRGALLEEQVELIRQLWTLDSVDFQGRFPRIDKASILPRPAEPVPIWFGGAAEPALRRAGRIGDGWAPLGNPSKKSQRALEVIRSVLQEEGRDPASFGIQAQAQFKGGDPERWHKHAEAWRELGATHLAIATTGAGLRSADEHLGAMQQYLKAARG